MSAAMLWPYGKCVECANKSDCVDSQAKIIACMSNGYPDYKPQTNADRVRAMSDEELAEFLWSIGQNPATGNTYLNGKFIFFCGDGNGWLGWLKQEATDG